MCEGMNKDDMEGWNNADVKVSFRDGLMMAY